MQDLDKMLEELLAGDIAVTDISEEADYCNAWRETVLPNWPCEPVALAIRGGRSAGQFAQVFIAGYQAAIRATFPQINFTGLATLAVSEDRNATDLLPGVTWREHAGGVELSGCKTWVAGCDQVEQLVVKARGQEPGQSGYFLVDASHPGLLLERNPTPSMLPQLSQGRAHLQAVVLPSSRHVEDDLVAGFGRVEALCIYAAFVAMVWQQSEHESTRRERVRALLSQLLEVEPNCIDPAQMRDIDQSVQGLRREIGEEMDSYDEAWLRDQRLIAMYSKGIQSAAPS